MKNIHFGLKKGPYLEICYFFVPDSGCKDMPGIKKSENHSSRSEEYPEIYPHYETCLFKYIGNFTSKN